MAGVLNPNCDVTTTHAPLPWLGAGSLRPAAVRGSTEDVVRGSGAGTVDRTGGRSSSGNEADRSNSADQSAPGNMSSDAVSSPAKTGSPTQQVKRSGSSEIDEVVEELVRMHQHHIRLHDRLFL